MKELNFMLSKNMVKNVFPELKIIERYGKVYIDCAENELKTLLKSFKVKKNDIPQELLKSGSRTRTRRYLSIDIYKINNAYFEIKTSVKNGVYLRELK